ncbi:hypothetical protein TWF506_003183 [Arthrobotrys conoides]|uniref:Uncharacterized protein n=1 Tax=Arthrobotrys conoides TaxID=74498 RepID=A0AAN8RKZ0_9PEZI
MFSEYIDDEDDFLALRMACHDFNAKFREAHLKCIYGVRRLFYASESFENLLKISRHPSGMNKYVRRIDICWSTPYYNYRAGRDQFVDQVRTNFLGKFSDIKEIALEISDIADRKAKEVVKLQESNEETALLSLALTGFSNLRSMIMARDLTGLEPLSRSELNLFFPKVGLAPGIRLHSLLKDKSLLSYHGFLYGLQTLGEALEPQLDLKYDLFWKLPIVSLVLSRVTHIETLIFHSSDLSNTSFFDVSNHRLSQFKTTFANLKTLKIQSIEVDSAGRDYLLKARFGDWLEAIGSNLQTLVLENPSP